VVSTRQEGSQRWPVAGREARLVKQSKTRRQQKRRLRLRRSGRRYAVTCQRWTADIARRTSMSTNGNSGGAGEVSARDVYRGQKRFRLGNQGSSPEARSKTHTSLLLKEIGGPEYRRAPGPGREEGSRHKNDRSDAVYELQQNIRTSSLPALRRTDPGLGTEPSEIAERIEARRRTLDVFPDDR